jgi:hypothetical protein
MVPIVTSREKKKEKTMGKKSIVSALLITWLLVMSGCASLQKAEHEYIMRGQVLEVTGSSAYICIGKTDGAQVGQEFTVYRFVRSGFLSPRNQQPSFKKEHVGRVKIEEIVHDHYSNANILAGSVKVNDVVELSK